MFKVLMFLFLGIALCAVEAFLMGSLFALLGAGIMFAQGVGVGFFGCCISVWIRDMYRAR